MALACGICCLALRRGQPAQGSSDNARISNSARVANPPGDELRNIHPDATTTFPGATPSLDDGRRQLEDELEGATQLSMLQQKYQRHFTVREITEIKKIVLEFAICSEQLEEVAEALKKLALASRANRGLAYAPAEIREVRYESLGEVCYLVIGEEPELDDILLELTDSRLPADRRQALLRSLDELKSRRHDAWVAQSRMHEQSTVHRFTGSVRGRQVILCRGESPEYEAALANIDKLRREEESRIRQCLESGPDE